MARYKGNDATRGLQGNVGDFFTYRQQNGKTVTSRQLGKRTKPITSRQEEVQDRFKEASVYANKVLENPVKAAPYIANAGNGKTAYTLIMTDFLKPPVVRIINPEFYTGQPDSVVKIRAKDDFLVIRVAVTITSATGALLEEGDAILDENAVDWNYTTTQVNDTLPGTMIRATAYDTPGNKGTKEFSL